MTGKRGRSGRKPGFGKTLEEHIRDGTFRHDRHGHLLDDNPAGLMGAPPKPAGIVTATARSQSRWIKNEADERAVRNGCRFNEALAEHFAECCRKFFCFSKGQWADDPFELTAWQRDELIWPLFGWVRDDGTRRFRRTYIEIPKKNYKSTTAAAIGLYMLMFDGEAGAEVYSLGADRDQARVVHNEATAIVEHSDALKNAIGINRTTGTLSYSDTHSTYKALSASPRGKHGINIHCAIADELHEWYGRELWDAVEYGMRARRQPLLFVITNAGDDMESICREQHDYARSIINGTTEDEETFALIMSADHAEALAELDAVKEGAQEIPVAKACNPGIGHVLSERDLVNEIRRAVATPSKIPNLLRLTYSVWSVGSDPWLDMSKWRECYEDFGKLRYRNGWEYTPGEIDLRGRECWAGLDLSKARDLTAVTLIFPDDDGVHRQLPLFWLPETTAEKRVNLAPYKRWGDEGFIRLMEGDVINYDEVVEDIHGLQNLFNVVELLYDPWQCEPMRQRLEPLGFQCVEFQQTISNFASPTADYERLVLNGNMRHNGNDVLSWQAGHVEVKSDTNKNKRPVKRKSGDFRTIDGIVAGVMGLRGAMSYEPQMSFYDDYELEAG